MTNKELKKFLDNGDYVKIARLVGYSDMTYGRKYVYTVLSGKITGKSGKAKRIIEAAHVIALQNEASGKSNEN